MKPGPTTKRSYHLQCATSDIGEYVLLPGDPARCRHIADHLSDATLVASNREFTTWLGRLGDVAVSVTSTGIGGPSTAIAVEELVALGAHTLIRVGTCGGMQATVRFGQIVVPTAAVRDEGTSRQYVPIGYPAVADRAVTTALLDAAKERGVDPRVGVVHSKDSFFGQIAPTTMPSSHELGENLATWIRAGVLASEMECAALFTVAALRGVRAGGVLVCVNEYPFTQELPNPTALPIVAEVEIAVAAVRRLIARSSSGGTTTPALPD